ncbi:MAG: hypothetical protein ACJA0B_000358 [Alcanivorax borkumensis]
MQFLWPGLALHLNQIGFGKLEPWITDACLKRTVIGQQQQAFRIPVQSAGRIHSRYADKLAQRSAALIVAEL